MALNRYRLEDEANKNIRRAKILRRLLEQPDRLLGTILLGNNLVNNAAVAIATILALRYFGETGVAASTAIITIVILVFAEVPPKTLAATHPDTISRFAADILNVLQRVLRPIIWLISLAARSLELFPGFKKNSSLYSLKQDELRIAIQAAEGQIAKDQHNYLLSILELGNVTVEGVMVPRSQVEAIDLEDDIELINQVIQSTEHSRLPLYRGSISDTSLELDVLVLYQQHNPDKEIFTLKEIEAAAIEPMYVPEDSNMMVQIAQMQESGRSMGVVVDEYGEIRGIITLQDMLEEIAGIVPLEERPTFKKVSQNIYEVAADVNVRDLNRIMNWDLPTDEATTLNGLILDRMQMVPSVGMVIKINDYVIEIQNVSGTSIEVVHIAVNTNSLKES